MQTRALVAVAALAALAGLATATKAQTIGYVTLTASATTVSVGDTFTIGVVLSDNIPGNSVFTFDILVAGAGAPFSTVPGSLVDDPSGSGFIFGFLGQVNPDGAQGLGGPADAFPPTFETPLDDLTVFTFQVLATHAGVITYTPEDGPSPNIAMQTWMAGGIILLPAWYDDIVFESVTVNVIPAPPAAALLALAVPPAIRRRRAEEPRP
ncbi:MAG: hypothetical protein R3B57_08925 [Phycisphaerales bacterium]